MDQSKPSTLGFTVSADLVSGLIDCATQCGVPRARLADMLDPGGPGRPAPTRYAGEHILRLWERILRETGDPIIGFRMAFFAGVKTFGVLGTILPRCATIFEAYRQTARYVALASQAAQFSVARTPKALTISVTLQGVPQEELSRAITIWGLTNLCLTPQRVAGAAVVPKEVTCAHPSPGPDALRVLRERLPFRFECEANAVIFDRSVGDITVPSADADLKKLLEETMDRHLAALGPAASFEQGVLTLLRGMMNGNMPTLASLSRRSGMSQRTLQRRLAEAGTSFQQLLRKVLHEASDQYLASGTMSHGEIAFLLGYSEESAFSRAYRSWTGHPPGAAAVRQAVR
jgi:AraC-like DNA-binding protein